MTNSSFSLGPKPTKITGGCLCASLRYRVIFPEDHDFSTNSWICQCTQCRKQTGGFFLATHAVPDSALEWTSGTETLKVYSASSKASRGFCGDCGSLMFWREDSGTMTSFTIGSVDALYLCGEGAGDTGGEVPSEGFGKALCSGTGNVEWCANEIKGVTDDMPLLNRGRRSKSESETELRAAEEG